ncbi:uncharacterized protein L3040_000987 [Drepanopeziza brunnea f. sp. 'multigermtubi']|uniref:Uncharacterized protein n=1 Tax=Marssonina brunnea f. sp. multigermtubi (strain MB_m1) TaxID=1072389 RepID=K1Y6R1_MARBU|nr:uncharacterized protein MBM_01566 [Drepanopeziza brunnea f. sp. 'multigermtubi' MB_m1]EKD20884.1 hypothetical protein MBM_01566 [Drepanopeziza brunnea f. sp. 'multigermtubi' MB_m1]KAJ5054721.1 hypothetical protein L3040_000987 [Drepanopeziza brunnea f. sp. 'multigermtubi']
MSTIWEKFLADPNMPLTWARAGKIGDSLWSNIDDYFLCEALRQSDLQVWFLGGHGWTYRDVTERFNQMQAMMGVYAAESVLNIIGRIVHGGLGRQSETSPMASEFEHLPPPDNATIAHYVTTVPLYHGGEPYFMWQGYEDLVLRTLSRSFDNILPNGSVDWNWVALAMNNVRTQRHWPINRNYTTRMCERREALLAKSGLAAMAIPTPAALAYIQWSDWEVYEP